MVNILWSIVNIENRGAKSDAKAATCDTSAFAEFSDLWNVKTEESLLKFWKTLINDATKLRIPSLVKKKDHDTNKKTLIKSKYENKIPNNTNLVKTQKLLQSQQTYGTSIKN